MKKMFKLLPVAALVFGIFSVSSFTEASCLGTWASCAENTTVEVEILPGDICIGSTGSFDFGNYTASGGNQTVTGAFTDYFWVDDLRGADSGYYTTLELSGDLAGPGGATIPAANVSAKVAGTGADLITGVANTRVDLPSSLLSYSALNSAVTFLKRDTAANFGVIGKYGKYPQLQLIIPAYQAVGSYLATLIYTIYEN